MSHSAKLLLIFALELSQIILNNVVTTRKVLLLF